MANTGIAAYIKSTRLPADGHTIGLPVTNGMNAPTLGGTVVCQSGVAYQPILQTGATIMKVSTVGIDLAKSVFQLHGVNELGKTVFKKQLRRDQMAGSSSTYQHA